MDFPKRWFLLMAGTAVILLAACSGPAPASDSTGEEEAGSDSAANTVEEATAVPEKPAEEGEVVTLFVGPEMVECEGEGPQMCLLVKENPDDEYQLFYSNIAGFNFEPGFEYEFDVLVEPVENPPAGGSSLKYTLVSENQKVPVATGEAGSSIETAEGEDLLSDSIWNLDSYTDQAGEATALLPGSEVTLAFEVGEFNGNASCNRYFGSYTINGEAISMGPIASTEMACGPEGLMAQESGYLTALGQVSRFQLGDNQLTLTNENGDVQLSFSTKEPFSLTGTIWQAIGYNNGRGGVVSVLEGTEITAMFEKDGTLSGTTGCNGFNTTYEIDGNNISISDLMAVTLRACTPEQAEQESAYLKALTEAATYTIEGDRLELRDAEGALLADYVALPGIGLTDATWVAIAYDSGGQAVVSVIGGTRLTTEFNEDGNLNGAAGCNNYFGSYSTEGDNIAIGPLGSTQMACAENIMQQEFAFLNALQAAATYRITGDTLEMFMEDGSLAASFQAEPPQFLNGTSWDVLSYNNGNQAVVSVVIGTELTANFGEDGTLAGSAGCNNYTAPYEADLQNIQIGPAATTRMACGEPEGIMEQEAQYLAALQTAATYRIDGHLLEMLTADDARVATFREKGYVDPEAINFLNQATFKGVDALETGEVTLEDGEFSQPVAEDSATELRVMLTEHVAMGEMNEQTALAAVVVADPGGSGTFYSLALFTSTADGLENTHTIPLGDRVQINSMEISDNRIRIDMVQHGPDDPLCCPTEHVINMYALEGGQLILIASDTVQE